MMDNYLGLYIKFIEWHIDMLSKDQLLKLQEKIIKELRDREKNNDEV